MTRLFLGVGTNGEMIVVWAIVGGISRSGFGKLCFELVYALHESVDGPRRVVFCAGGVRPRSSGILRRCNWHLVVHDERAQSAGIDGILHSCVIKGEQASCGR